MCSRLQKRIVCSTFVTSQMAALKCRCSQRGQKTTTKEWNFVILVKGQKYWSSKKDEFNEFLVILELKAKQYQKPTQWLQTYISAASMELTNPVLWEQRGRKYATQQQWGVWRGVRRDTGAREVIGCFNTTDKSAGIKIKVADHSS